MLVINVDRNEWDRVKASMFWMDAGVMEQLKTQVINDTLHEIKDATIDKAMGIANLPKDEVAKRIHLREASATETGAITVSDRKIPVKYFSPVQTESGVVYRATKTGRSTLIKGAFGPQIPRLGKNAFKRQTKKRLPIEKQFGPSLATLLSIRQYAGRETENPWAEGPSRLLRQRFREAMDKYIRNRQTF